MKSSTTAYLFTILFFFITVRAQDIPVGSTLSPSVPNTKWSSPTNTFVFTFITQQKLLDPTSTTTTSTVYYAAILYDNSIPIWVAGGATSNGGAADSTATLQLLSDGNLILRNGTTNSTVWQSNTTGLSISAASLDDSGNFKLKNDTVSSIWSTFDNPTDTMVPTQNITLNHTLRSGPYSFNMLSNGNLTLNWNDTIRYYNSGLNSTANVTSPSLSIAPIGIITISDPRLSNSLTLVFSSDYAEAGNILRFMKLDNDGNLRIYSSTKGTSRKDVRWSAMSDQCEVFGYCGNNGICRYDDTGPICGCASENFELIDPTDKRQGCKRTREISDCLGSETMLELDHAMFLTYSPENAQQAFSSGISACRLNCLVSTGCVASTTLADGTGMCNLKSNVVTSFVSGYQSPHLPSTSFMKVCSPVIPNPAEDSSGVEKKNGWKLKAWVIVIVVFVTILVLIGLEGGLWLCCFRNSPKFAGLSTQYALLEYASGAPVQFSYKELHRATKGFKEKLGAGGFGSVYGGVLTNRTVVAVKQLEGIEQGEKQFRMEVATISSTHHLNLVRLIGFCSEGRHRLLVYEFMKNGSLDNLLFTGESGKLLNWQYRYKIALGTARGITYLHEECRDCIIHCDIKPENILLDENYNAKVSDFGLAKLINPKEHRHRSLTSVRGTRGYLAPEWLANLPTTSKSDVYSYGMVLLEIVSGKRNFEVSSDTNNKKFTVWAYEEFEKGNAETIIDKRLPTHDMDMEQVMRAILVSFWCIQEQPSQRPMMGKVVQMLEGITEIERPPAPRVMTTDGSLTGSSINASSSVSGRSTFATSAPPPSSTSSLTPMNVERASSSSLLRSSEPATDDMSTSLKTIINQDVKFTNPLFH